MSADMIVAGMAALVLLTLYFGASVLVGKVIRRSYRGR